MIYLSPMPGKNEKKILAVVELMAKTLKPFKVKLSDFEKGGSGYIFVGVEKSCHKQLKNIRKELIDRLLPYRGSLVKKNVKGHEYYYLVYREEGKVKSDYKGKVSKSEIQKYKQVKEYRAKYRKLLSQVKKQIRFLRSTLRGKETV